MSNFYIRCSSYIKWGTDFQNWERDDRPYRDLSIVKNKRRVNMFRRNFSFKMEDDFSRHFISIDQCKTCKFGLKMVVFKCYHNNYEKMEQK